MSNTTDRRPLAVLSDNELRSLGGSRAAGELARRAHRRRANPSPRLVGREAIHAIAAAHVIRSSPPAPRVEYRSAGVAAALADGDAELFIASGRAARAQTDLMAARAAQALSQDHARTMADRRDFGVIAPPGDPWGALLGRAYLRRPTAPVTGDPDNREAEIARDGLVSVGRL